MVLIILWILTWHRCRPGKGQITAASCQSSFPTGGTLHDRRGETKSTTGLYCADDDHDGSDDQPLSTLLQFL